MTNITSLPQYVNFSKLQEFNQTLPVPVINNYSEIMTGVIGIFALYPILQWFTSFMLFIILFLVIKKVNMLEYTDLQIVMLSSFVIVAVNTILLIASIFTILQPLELFFMVWLVTFISIRFKNRNS